MSKTYEDGLNEAWEAVKKIMCIVGSGITPEEREKIFGDAFAATIIEDYTAAEVIAKIEKYEENNINIGDEVTDNDGWNGVVIRISPDGEYLVIMQKDGAALHWKKESFKKTGRHFSQIEEVLKQMQEDTKDEQ